ncbi:hypothetical protein BN126360279 [Stenotrophomonas indicatrix]|nr:hypothetical protein BN126360279 [Stenotrophomonas indicatrix]
MQSTEDAACDKESTPLYTGSLQPGRVEARRERVKSVNKNRLRPMKGERPRERGLSFLLTSAP